VHEYFETVGELCQQQNAWCELPPPKLTEARHDMDYLTNFERKFRREGRPIYRALYEKRGVS
jgi:tRNA (guanine-N7-)-methyltransferase